MKILLTFFILVTGHFTNCQVTGVIDPVPTTIDSATAQKMIEEVISSKNPPKADRVETFSRLTRYGFKNLFNQFSYNSSLPYASQVNPNAEFFMQDYLRSHGSYLVKMKSWGTPYFNVIDNILSQYGLPNELKYLAVIESNLQTSATSWVGAGGPWQFMPYTARDYGLKVTNQNDERRDYFKSTHAAARYLLNLYNQLHDWLLVIAAYNGGPGVVYSAIKKSGSTDFWKLQHYLPPESRNHVKKFIATHYVMENAVSNSSFNSAFFKPQAGQFQQENNASLPATAWENTEKLILTGKYQASAIAKNLTMNLDLFNKYNPGFDERIGANGSYEMILPADKMKLFKASKYQILEESIQLLLEDTSIQPGKPKPAFIKKKSAGKSG